MMFYLLVLAFDIGLVLSQNGTECSKVFFEGDSFVCACGVGHCDYMGQIEVPPAGLYARIVSSRDEFRFDIFQGIEQVTPTNDITIVIDHQLEYQSMIGFGGAFTDATGINVLSLPEDVQESWIRSYFSEDGIEYDLCRIPIGGSDFSTYPYTYDEVAGDVDLVNFSLTQEDHLYKIPLIQRASEASPRTIRLFGSPWSPPPWMKENGMHNGTGGLLREMWDPYANYLLKFVEAYESYGLEIWGITPQNEPLNGFQDFPWNTCAWTKTEMRDWIKTSLGPIFGDAGLRRIKVMVLDHNRLSLPDYPAATFEDAEANQYVDGTAVHWYNDGIASPLLLTETSSLFPDKFLLYTESCEGWDSGADERVVLGSWQRAESYAENIIEDVNHFVTGWVDWNMALDMRGGPNWANNFVDSPTIVDSSNGVFYKQPMFYAMGHFSKFLKEGSVRMYTNVEGDRKVKAAAFHSPPGEESLETIIVLNKDDEPKKISILSHSGTYLNMELYPKSIETILLR